MSAATDGFSAMMSFLARRRESPQMISAKAEALQPPNATLGLRARACAREARAVSLVGQAVLRPAEQLFCDQLAGRRLLIPQHHQHDQLELLDRDGRARSGEGARDPEVAVLSPQDPPLLVR